MKGFETLVLSVDRAVRLDFVTLPRAPIDRMHHRCNQYTPLAKRTQWLLDIWQMIQDIADHFIETKLNFASAGTLVHWLPPFFYLQV